MAEKEVARESDLQAHIRGDWKVVHKIWDNVKAAINEVYNSLWRDNTNNDVDDVFIQTGVDTVPVGSDVTVTFDIAFSAAPRVVASCTGTTKPFIVNCHSIGTTSFQMRGVQWDNGSGTSKACSWIAIGRKDR